VGELTGTADSRLFSGSSQPFGVLGPFYRVMSRNDFDRFVADNGSSLLRTAYLMVGDLHAAEDLVQETLFKVASKWSRVCRMDNPVAYTRRILVNQALHGSAKRSRNRAELKAAPPPEPASEPHLDIDCEVFDALVALPPRQRAALVLRYFLDLPEAEVAAVLGCSLGTVKSSTSRGLKRLEETLRPTNPYRSIAL
jgi:RNA polymerase sigma-70 factor (sigma-E family)